jgi:hypothetical protein
LLFTADTFQKTTLKTMDDKYVLNVKIKTEAEEDRDQLEHQVSVSSLSFDFQ